LLWEGRRFSTPRKADAADRLLYTRESIAEFPNLWVSGLDFARPSRLSDANPQQAEYRWATVELVHWRGADGTPLAGLLYKPTDFDSTKQYPMIVNFYERSSDNLHAHSPVIPHRSTIRPSFYASRGYLVFVPDVVYTIGYPGQSALDCVVPGVLELIERGYVDAEHIGLQGHSWGGYQIAYMVTKTNLFAAGAPGAPVANMTSAYGGIRWESGMSRMFQYERTQSRLGAALWDAPIRYLENSPLFWLDRVRTPLLILHNDNDGAVPWYQGIELFTALRRLGRPAWLVNYNGEPHWPLPYPKRRDWNIRMQQFFDHYLQGAPAPRWMTEGVPAVEKGRTLGLETEWE
jgi:dipeptidyl aminopeptidase/acylaminoacyl peptidase